MLRKVMRLLFTHLLNTMNWSLVCIEIRFITLQSCCCMCCMCQLATLHEFVCDSTLHPSFAKSSIVAKQSCRTNKGQKGYSREQGRDQQVDRVFRDATPTVTTAAAGVSPFIHRRVFPRNISYTSLANVKGENRAASSSPGLSYEYRHTE